MPRALARRRATASRVSRRARSVVLLILVPALVLSAACGSEHPAAPSVTPAPSPVPAPPLVPPTTVTVGSGGDFSTIQEGLDAVAEGGLVSVGPGIYGDRVFVRRRVTLLGDHAVIDGLAGPERGIDSGVRIEASGVEFRGFTIQKRERGLVLDRVVNCRVTNNEIRRNYSKDPPPISAGVTKSDGMVLDQSHQNEIADNYVHDNGTLGLYIRNSSARNRIHRNRLVDNGWQQESSGRFGAGLLSQVGNNDENEIVDNEISGNDWGLRNGGAAQSDRRQQRDGQRPGEPSAELPLRHDQRVRCGRQRVDQQHRRLRRHRPLRAAGLPLIRLRAG